MKNAFAILIVVLLLLSAGTLRADQFGLFTYEIEGGTIAIIHYPSYAIGDVEIPATIEGNPVTRIGPSAFRDCSGLTSVTIPATVTRMGYQMFRDCSSLTSIIIPQGVKTIPGEAFFGCSGLTKVTIPSSVWGYGPRAFSDCKSLTSFAIHEGVLGIVDIREEAFSGCRGLTSITIPSSVSHELLSKAFSDCSALTTAIFLGNAPFSFGSNVFDNTAPGFSIYYLSSSKGFTSPTWKGYPATEIHEDAYPAARWLLRHDFPYNTDLNQDTNDDGVSLLMAYALNLNPNINLQSSLPEPVLVGDNLSMTFHATSPGIAYTVETSTNLQSWKTEGVTLSEIGADNRRTASVRLDAPERYLRLKVEN